MRKSTKAAIYIVLIIGALFILLPFAWMILTALKSSKEVLAIPVKWIPSTFRWENFTTAYQAAPFAQYLKNSILVSLGITVGELVTTIFAAYAFAVLPFPGKKLLFTLLISTMMVPSEILIIPNYITLSDLGWIDSYKALILPWCASVFSIFLLRQRFENVNKGYRNAAIMDGCKDLSYLFRVLIPMSMPTIASITILKIIASWNSYMWPLIVTNSNELRTLPLALSFFSTEAGTSYHILMAFSLMIIAPILILYILMQKIIIQGVGDSGIKS